MRRVLGLIAAAAALLLAGACQASPFSDWSAVVVAGDWHAHDGGPSEAFDNARRDVADALVKAGFEGANIRQFSVRPERYKDTKPEKSDINAIYGAMNELAAKAPGGCLFYMTSHGAPQGAVLDRGLLTPGVLAGMLDNACGKRPTVVVPRRCTMNSARMMTAVSGTTHSPSDGSTTLRPSIADSTEIAGVIMLSPKNSDAPKIPSAASRTAVRRPSGEPRRRISVIRAMMPPSPSLSARITSVT